MEYIKVSEAALKWSLSTSRVRFYCAQNLIAGVIRKGKLYMIPVDAPKPNFARSSQGSTISIEKLLRNIDAKRTRYSLLRPAVPEEERRLREEFIVEYTYNSIAIEGNELTLKETALVLDGVILRHKSRKEHLEAIGHKDGFVYVEMLVSDREQISDKHIMEIHSYVLMNYPEEKGIYRRVPVRIMGALHQPPQPHKIDRLMNDLLVKHRERKASMHIIEAIALFHLDFEGIHPFVDGNGRTGRLLINLELMLNGYPPIDIKYTDRKRYYEAFDAYYLNNSADAMTRLIAEYVFERLNNCLIMKRRSM